MGLAMKQGVTPCSTPNALVRNLGLVSRCRGAAWIRRCHVLEYGNFVSHFINRRHCKSLLRKLATSRYVGINGSDMYGFIDTWSTLGMPALNRTSELLRHVVDAVEVFLVHDGA